MTHNHFDECVYVGVLHGSWVFLSNPLFVRQFEVYYLLVFKLTF